MSYTAQDIRYFGQDISHSAQDIRYFGLDISYLGQNISYLAQDVRYLRENISYLTRLMKIPSLSIKCLRPSKSQRRRAVLKKLINQPITDNKYHCYGFTIKINQCTNKIKKGCRNDNLYYSIKTKN